MGIKRWNHTLIHVNSDDVESSMVTSSRGRYVSYEDHAVEVARLTGEMDRAKNTLAFLGYTDNGGEQWKPPVGPRPDFDLVSQYRQRAEAADEDVARLNEQVRALQSDATLAADTLKNANDVVLEAKAKFEHTSDENIDLRLQLRAMAAENAEQSRYINEAKKCISFYVPDSDKPSKVQIPATDAILNEVRAQAVEAYCDEMDRKGVVTPRDFAARIRAGEVQP